LAELEIPQLDRARAFSYSPALFDAYATVLEDLGRTSDAAEWRTLAERAREALGEVDEDVVVVDEEELEFDVSNDDGTDTLSADVDVVASGDSLAEDIVADATVEDVGMEDVAVEDVAVEDVAVEDVTVGDVTVDDMPAPGSEEVVGEGAEDLAATADDREAGDREPGDGKGGASEGRVDGE
jgi:hypothetical protein